MAEPVLLNDPGNDVSRLVQAASESLTDGMIERLSETGGNALEVLDKLNDEETKDAVLYAVDKLTEMHRIGALDTVFQLLHLIHGARDALTDNMVERLFLFGEHMVTNLANEEVADLAHNAKEAMHFAADEATAAKAKGGLLSTVALLSKPETQQALHFLLAFACNMRAATVKEDQE